jgi:hypothetical protein
VWRQARGFFGCARGAYGRQGRLGLVQMAAEVRKMLSMVFEDSVTFA